MFTSRHDIIPGEGESPGTPGYLETMGDSLRAAYVQPFILDRNMDPEERTQIQTATQSLEQIANAGDQSYLQKGANFFAGVVGSALNPINATLGGAAGKLVGPALEGVGPVIGRYVPVPAAVVGTAIAQKKIGSIVGEEVPAFVGDKTIGQLSKGAIQGAVTGTAFSFPQEVANTHDPKNNTFNWWGGAKASFADGGLTLALMAVPYLGGTLWGKMFGEAVDHAAIPEKGSVPVTEPGSNPHPTIEQIQSAVQSGRLTPDEGQWMHDYVTGNDTNDNLTARATNLLIKDGHPIDAATKKVLLRLFKPEDIDQLQTALADQLASNIPDHMKSMLSDFMMNGNIDTVRGNTKMLDGLEGVSEFIKRKIASKDSDLSSIKAMLKQIFPENIKGNNPFHQTKIFNALKAGREVGITVPRQVERRMRQERNLRILKKRIEKNERLFDKTGEKRFVDRAKSAQNRIDEINSKLEPLLSHKEELDFIRSRLLKDGVAKRGYQFTREYQRLLDLARDQNASRIKNSSLNLIHEIHLADEFNKHENLSIVLDTITQSMRAAVGSLTKNDDVLNYMKERMGAAEPETGIRLSDLSEKPVVERLEATAEDDSTKAFKDDAVESFEKDLQGAPDFIKEDFDSFKKKFDEFNKKQSIFEKVMSCAVGVLNGRI